MSNESTDVVEIDAIGVDEWEHEQHTPRAMDENLAALVKQSSTAQSGPARAPTVDDAWEADGHGEPAKQRTTTNTVARPAPPKQKTKTMALPTIAAKPAAPKATAVPKAIPRVETKPIASPTAAKPHTGDQPPPGFVEVKPLAARGAAKPAAKPQPKPVAKPAATPPAMAAAPKPVAKPVAKPTPPPMAAIVAEAAAAPKPVAKPTPPPMAAIVAQPVAAPKPVAKPTPPPMAAIVAEPAAVTVVLAEVKPERAPTPLPFAPMTLPAWPPTTQFEDWDSPESAATSVGNRISPSRPVSSDFKPEDSVIVDLNAKSTSADKPRRPQTYPVIQTSEQKPSTSGVFVMPTAAQPNAVPVAPERVSAPELPPPPAAPIAASSSAEVDRASSPGWNTPLPERLPGEPVAAPAAPSWPSASGLLYEPSAPVADEPVPSLARPSIFAPLLPLLRNRGVVIGIAAAAVLAIVVVAIGSHDSKQPQADVAATKPEPTVAAAAMPMHATPSHAGATSAPATPVAAVETVPSPKVPAKVAMRRISRSKRPVVVDYDKKPSSALDDDQALAQARAVYAIGNQHLFAGEGQEAVTAYRKALEIYPGYAAGYRGLGLAFAQLDDKPSALAAFKTYVKLAPTAKDVALIQKRIRSLSVH